MSSVIAREAEPRVARATITRLVIALVLAGLADLLFYGWSVGISFPLFLAGLAVAAVAVNGRHAPLTLQIAMTAILLGAFAAAIEDISALSVIVSLAGTVSFVIVVTTEHPMQWHQYLIEASATMLRGPIQFAVDMLALLRRLRRNVPEWLAPRSLVAWIVPLVASATFLALFASANPLIEHALKLIDLSAGRDMLEARRMMFWVGVVAVTWSLIARRPARECCDAAPFKAAEAAPNVAKELDGLFSAQAISRSLILFNGLFAVQTASDLAFLWGGLSLLDGITHAEYAHRGAYPLIITALLAAAFVLIATRADGPASSSRWIRPLVLLWTTQNVLLVISAILRLDLYVVAYSLTYWRLAAGIWMMLTAIGLVLILLQVWLHKPVSWLVAANMISLAIVLYGCCFLNAPRTIAFFNLAHCHEIDGSGPNLDTDYLESLGPQALPAVEVYMDRIPMLQVLTAPRMRTSAASLASAQGTNWRAWSYRGWRLKRYLDDHGLAPSLLKMDRG